MDEKPLIVTPQIKPKEIKPVNYTDNERRFLNELIQMLVTARNDRDMPHPELDGMTYLEYYGSNRKKDLSYLPPKKNKQDVRITTGHTREKDTTLLSTMLNMNFVPDITAFDREDMIVAELGDNMSDLVKKSREIEVWQKKRGLIYRELISQGDVFVQELHVEDFRDMPLEDVEWNPAKDKIADFSLKTRLQKVFSGCATRMITGKKVYLFNIRTEHIEDQPGVVILNVYSRLEAYSRYGTWERWANVPTTIDTTQAFEYDDTVYKSWNLVSLDSDDKVAEVMVYLPKRNLFAILLNGVLMTPVNLPMTAIAPSGEIPISQGKFEPISDFAYSKSQPSKTKIDQEVLDEATKLMIEGMRQGRKPPKGSRHKKVYSSDIFVAGKITPDIKDGDLFDLLESPGLTQADFSFYELIKQGIQDKTVNDAYEGQRKGDPTATQYMEEKQQQMLKLGLALDGVMNLERRMTWNRIYGILQHWTTKYDPDMDSIREKLDGQYRKISVDSALEAGQKGLKMFRFTTDAYPSISDQLKEERDLSEKYGKEVRVVYINPEVLRATKYQWFIVINPTPQSNDHLSQILFVQNMQNAMNLFGPESLNAEYLKQRFAILINEDFNKYFKKMDVMQMLQTGQLPTQGGAPANGIQGGVKRAAGTQPLKAVIE